MIKTSHSIDFLVQKIVLSIDCFESLKDFRKYEYRRFQVESRTEMCLILLNSQIHFE